MQDWKYVCYVWLSKGAIVHPFILLNVNTYANSVVESLFVLMKFIEVLINVYLPYGFNCWSKWMHILRKWTAKGVSVLTGNPNILMTRGRVGTYNYFGFYYLSWFKFQICIENIHPILHQVSLILVKGNKYPRESPNQTGREKS